MSRDTAAYEDEGLFSPESLNVTLGFTRAAHEAAVIEMGRTGRPPEEIKTYLHELTHYVQHTTTPYWLFIHYCRQLQTADTVEMVRALLSAGVPVRRPLLEHAPLSIEGTVGSTIRGARMRWVNTEVLVAFLGQNRDKLLHYLARFIAAPAHTSLLTLLETFRRLQGGIAHFIENENAMRNARGLPPWDNGMLDADALNAEGSRLDERFALNLERTAVSIDLLGNPWGTESIIESAATVAEWTESGADLSALRAFAADTTDPELAMYKYCLALGLEAIRADDLPQFAFTFIALCELALHAPLLPQHATLRAGRIDPLQLFPALRFWKLLGPVSRIRPLEGLADVARFSLELCRALDWVQPTQIIAAALKGPETVADRRSQRYTWAQSERARGQHAFTNLLRRAFDPASGEQFRQRYVFPVIEYADRTFYMRDKDALWDLTTQHLLTMTMRQIMLGTTLTVTCPYRGAPAEAETLTTWLRAELQMLFGRPFPMARVVSRQ
jgi:hypothetical protein